MSHRPTETESDMEEGEIEIENIILESLVNTMQRIGTFKGLRGREKKRLVLRSLKVEFDIPEALLVFLTSVIDTLISVENGIIIFNAKPKQVANSITSLCCGGRGK